MVRSMYSGVSGMRTHQTAMDTIGNNIANVNTYGFKGSRTTFADIYYQSLRGASAASATRGGVNSSQVGVGSQVRSVDLMMTRSSFTQTDMTMDLAIDGEGFLQVMDADGNKYYTRAGQLLFDANGNLVDSKGNFVLGTNGDPYGREPGSEKIQVNLGTAEPTKATVTQSINNVEWTITANNTTEDGNVGISFMADNTLALGELCKAEVTDSGIVVHVNANETFQSVTDLQNAMNAAIDRASQDKIGKNHPSGGFTIDCKDTSKFPITGADLCSSDYSVKTGSITGLDTTNTQGFTYSGVGSGFLSDLDDATLAALNASGTAGFNITANADGDYEIKIDLAVAAAAGPPAVTAVNKSYTGILPKNQVGSGKMNLYLGGNKNSSDYIQLNFPDLDGGTSSLTPTTAAQNIKGNGFAMTASLPKNSMGLSSKSFLLEKGTEGGPQGIESLTGVSIGVDGSITGHHNLLGDVKIGRIDLATFVNPSGLSAAGGTYFTTSPNSGTMTLTKPGQGGSGQVVSGSLELSNVDLSREFTDMIKTQRGYQANSRIITVSDTMLEELVNLKR